MFHKLKTVLVVEDAADQRLILQALLGNFGLTVLTAEDGRLATRILETTDVDLLITDFRMPHMDGASLLQWCRNRALEMPVIFLSSEVHLFKEEELALKDCCSLLMKKKPMDIAFLTAAIQAADIQNHGDDCPFRSFKEVVDELVEKNERVLPGQDAMA